MGNYDRPPTEEDEQDIFDGLPEVLNNKTERVGTCRWFQLITSAEAFKKVWTRRLLFIVFYLNILGDKIQTDKLNVDITARSEDADVEKTTTKHDKEEVRKIRRGCKNTMHFLYCLLGQRVLWTIAVIISVLAKPVKKWHEDQNTTNRSGEASRKWWTERAVDRGLPHLNEIFETIDVDLYSALELHTSGSEECWTQREVDAVVVSEDHTMNMIADFSFALVRRRSRSLMHFEGAPFMFYGICDDKEGEEFCKVR